jgi:hypothetical protein
MSVKLNSVHSMFVVLSIPDSQISIWSPANWTTSFPSKYCINSRTVSHLVQRRVLYSGSRIFNHLPLQIKNHSGNLKSFQRKLKNFLVEHALYSLHEFYQLTPGDWNY